jgi:hypothetical protein
MPDHLLLPERFLVPSRRQLGGGGATPARNPHRHGTRLQRRLAEAAAASPRATLEGIDPGLVFKVRASGRLDPSALESRDLALLGETRDWTYFVFSEEEAPQRFLAALGRYSGAADSVGAAAPLSSLFGLIEDFEPYGADDRRGPRLPAVEDVDDRILVDVIIWPSPEFGESRRRIANVRVVVENDDGAILAFDDRPQFTIVRTRVSGIGLSRLLELAVVEQVRTPPTPFIEPSDWMAADVADLVLETRESEPIGVIDDGISDGHPLLAEVVVSQRSFPSEYAWLPIGNHGTMVAGLCAYGDFEAPLRDHAPLVAAGPLHGARVMEPHPDLANHTRFAPTLPEHQVVEEAIRTLHAEHGVRLFNLSITYSEPFTGSHVGLLTEQLDSLVRELGIVVVISAGNVRATTSAELPNGQHALHDYPEYLLDEMSRVSEPATAALAITVGSLARSSAPQTPGGVVRVGDRAVAEVNEVSPFSRTGPGAGRAVKPDMVAFGGNWVITDVGRLDSNNLGVGVVSTTTPTAGRLFQMGSGTSYSAPRITRLAADVWGAYPEASANLVRCIVALSCRAPREAAEQFSDPEHQRRAFGYGAADSTMARESGGNRVVMTFDGVIGADSVAIHPLPIPEDFARGRSSRRIAAALAFDPPVRRQRREYLAGAMTFDLLRAVDIQQLRDIYSRQDDEREAMLSDRRRVSLQPGTTRVLASTLQVREWRPRLMNLDDGDTYFLVVTHRRAQWSAEAEQTYAIAVELVDEDRLNLDVYNLVQQRVQVAVRARIRAR